MIITKEVVKGQAMHVVELAISLVAPHMCVICSSSESVFCNECRVQRITPLISRCVFCNTLTNSDKVCSLCSRKHKVNHVWSVTEYRNVEAIIKKYKFERARALFKPLAEEMLEVIGYADIDVVVSVPTAPSRIRTRGYDHAQLLGRYIANKYDVPYLRPLIHVGSLKQIGASRTQRFRQAEETYKPKTKVSIKNLRVLLVDDVVTTGATISACAKQLKAVGAKSIDVVTFARRL